MPKLVKIEHLSQTCYPKAFKVNVGRLVLWFSYHSIIAFEYDGQLVISENAWSNTTGRHLNRISRDKKIRVPREEFLQRLDSLFNQLNL